MRKRLDLVAGASNCGTSSTARSPLLDPEWLLVLLWRHNRLQPPCTA
jgi:hypothetical protein